LNAQDVTQLGGLSGTTGGDGEGDDDDGNDDDDDAGFEPFADPELRRDERRGGGLALCAAQGLGMAAAAAPVPKSVSKWGKAVSGAGPVVCRGVQWLGWWRGR
jgi:hypothetical protein